MNFDNLLRRASELGATNTAVISVSDIVFDSQFRQSCESNACGKHATNYSCPPVCGTVEQCINRVKKYKSGVLVQLIEPLEDSFDWEGMMASKGRHESIMQVLRTQMPQLVGDVPFFSLGAGGCSICERCNYLDKLPCRHPDQMMSSIEAHCMDVTQLAKLGGFPFSWSDCAVYYMGIFLF